MTQLSKAGIISVMIFILSFGGFFWSARQDCVNAQTSDEDQVKQVVLKALNGMAADESDKFMADFSRTDFNGSLFEASPEGGKIRELKDFEAFKAGFDEGKGARVIISFQDVSISKVTITDDKASLFIKFSISIVPFKKNELVTVKRRVSVSLKKEDGAWKITKWQQLKLEDKPVNSAEEGREEER